MAKTTPDRVRALIGRLGDDAVHVFQGAASLCGSRRHFDATPDHLLLRLFDDVSGDITRILKAFNVDRGKLRRACQHALDDLPAGHGGKPALSEGTVEVLESASVLAEETGHDKIRPGHLLLAIALNPRLSRVPEFTPEFERIDAGQLREHFSTMLAGSAGADEPAGGNGAASAAGSSSGGGAALDQFTVDLTAKARAGEIDAVYGRDFEIRQMIDILSRRRKNNPILVGDPGTGKTAIVEGLALRIVEGDVPHFLKDVRLVTLDLGLLQAGAGVKGEFENRLKNVINEIKASPVPMITFIDEAHTLIGAGGQAGGGDAANLLKPALARGELRTIAATTWAEYKKYFEKDAALERRFQLVRCDEPAEALAVVMLRGLKDKYEKHHKVVILDEAITAAVKLSKRYISGRYLPDKAVDLLDTASARVAVALSTRPGALENLQRQIAHVDTAITAIQRDEAGGVETDAAMLGELQSERAQLTTQIAEIESRWKTELESARAIAEMRASLAEYKTVAQDAGASTVEPPATPADAAAAGAAKPAPAPPPPPAAASTENAPNGDPAATKPKLVEALGKHKTLQGEDPLVFPHVDASIIASIISDWTGIPVGKMVRDEAAAVLQMESRLAGRVVGQDHALAGVAHKLRAAKSGMASPTQPMGVFLLVGPSGVGKTELALSVADLLFGGDRFLVTVNMSEFMEKHTISRLIGSPPGYVGFGEGGLLTEAVRQHPYSVVLLDEVEKAHPEVMNLFYQVFDKGTLADGESRVVDFSNTVIFLTSNLGTDVIQGMCESGEPVTADALREGIYPHLREHFKPALLARMTVIPFLALPQEVLRSIARMKLGKLVNRISTAHKIDVNVDDGVYSKLAEGCTQVDLGARQIDHAIDRHILPDLSRRILERMAENRMPRGVRMSANDGGDFAYEFVDA